MGGGLESRCLGRVYGADGAVRWHQPHRTHDLPSGSQDHDPSKNSVQKIICCKSTSNAPDDGRMYPKHVELRVHQYNYLVASSWHFTLFHEEDARSNNSHLIIISDWLSVNKHYYVYTRSLLGYDHLQAFTNLPPLRGNWIVIFSGLMVAHTISRPGR